MKQLKLKIRSIVAIAAIFSSSLCWGWLIDFPFFVKIPKDTFFDASVSPVYEKNEFGDTSETKSGLLFNFYLGSHVLRPLRFGGRYFRLQMDQSNSGETKKEIIATAFGASLGINILSSYTLDLSYYLNPEKEEKAATTTKDFGSSGLSIDLTYHFSEKDFTISPAVSFYQLQYSKRSVDGNETTLEKKHVESIIRPSLRFTYHY